MARRLKDEPAFPVDFAYCARKYVTHLIAQKKHIQRAQAMQRVAAIRMRHGRPEMARAMHASVIAVLMLAAVEGTKKRHWLAIYRQACINSDGGSQALWDYQRTLSRISV